MNFKKATYKNLLDLMRAGILWNNYSIRITLVQQVLDWSNCIIVYVTMILNHRGLCVSGSTSDRSIFLFRSRSDPASMLANRLISRNNTHKRTRFSYIRRQAKSTVWRTQLQLVSPATTSKSTLCPSLFFTRGEGYRL